MATIQDCNRALRMLPGFARDEAQQTVDTTAFQIARAAAVRAPVRTGFLKRSIGWKSRPRSVSAVVGVERHTRADLSSESAFYWKFLEYGTVKMSARPIFRPAAEAMAADHDRRMIAGLERALTRMEQEAR